LPSTIFNLAYKVRLDLSVDYHGAEFENL
jgi:hypothetical protein